MFASVYCTSCNLIQFTSVTLGLVSGFILLCVQDDYHFTWARMWCWEIQPNITCHSIWVRKRVYILVGKKGQMLQALLWLGCACWWQRLSVALPTSRWRAYGGQFPYAPPGVRCVCSRVEGKVWRNAGGHTWCWQVGMVRRPRWPSPTTVVVIVHRPWPNTHGLLLSTVHVWYPLYCLTSHTPRRLLKSIWFATTALREHSRFPRHFSKFNPI